MANEKNNESKKRYKYDKRHNVYTIDISIDYYSDLYNEWDFSPLKKRDLDENLVSYLEECFYEIPMKAGVEICFHMDPAMRDYESEKNSIKGLKNYLSYWVRKISNDLRDDVRNTVLYALSGAALLTVASLAPRFIPNSTLSEIVIEGMFIGAWVLMWELFSVIFFQSRMIRKRKKIYTKLSVSRFYYEYGEEQRF